MGDFNYTTNPKTGNGMHSITFVRKDGKTFNTWDTWYMAPKSRPFVAAPQVKTEYVDVPGADGALDYTEVLTGRPRYANRTGQWDFIIENGHKDWHALYSEILTCLHGRYIDKIILDDDPDFKWSGRLSITGQFGNKDYSSVSIQYNLDPYKYPVDSTKVSNWRWNDLFSNDILYGGFNVRGVKFHTVYNDTGYPLTATIRCTNQMKLYKINSTDELYDILDRDFDSRYSYTQLQVFDNDYDLDADNNYLIFVGNGSVKISYERGGSL